MRFPMQAAPRILQNIFDQRKNFIEFSKDFWLDSCPYDILTGGFPSKIRQRTKNKKVHVCKKDKSGAMIEGVLPDGTKALRTKQGAKPKQETKPKSKPKRNKKK
jgi:hypothetical protein